MNYTDNMNWEHNYDGTCANYGQMYFNMVVDAREGAVRVSCVEIAHLDRGEHYYGNLNFNKTFPSVPECLEYINEHIRRFESGGSKEFWGIVDYLNEAMK